MKKRTKPDLTADEFINAADTDNASSDEMKSAAPGKPKSLNLRLSAEHAEMLDQLAKKTNRSKQKMIIHLLEKAAAEQL